MNTILAVTFAWSLAFALFVIWRLFRCRHKWDLVDKTEMGSRLEEASRLGVNVHFMPNWYAEHMTYKQLVLVMRCAECGAAKIHKIKSAGN